MTHSISVSLMLPQTLLGLSETILTFAITKKKSFKPKYTLKLGRYNVVFIRTEYISDRCIFHVTPPPILKSASRHHLWPARTRCQPQTRHSLIISDISKSARPRPLSYRIGLCYSKQFLSLYTTRIDNLLVYFVLRFEDY